MKRLVIALLLFAALTHLISIPAYSAPLGPGESLAPPPSVALSAGATSEANTNAGILEPTFSGEWITAVLTNDSDNPFGGLTFVYLFTKIGASTNSSQLVLEGFSGFQVDVGYDPNAIQPESKAPTFAGRDAAGNVLTVDYPGFDPNVGFMSTFALLVRTDSHAWKTSSAFLSDGSTAVLPAFEPAVPEPSSFLLAALAGIGLLALRRRSPSTFRRVCGSSE